jgi:serine/threonine protein kinase
MSHIIAGIYHFDLKPPNLFIGDNWVVKVADFGISQFKDNITAIGGTPNYMVRSRNTHNI